MKRIEQVLATMACAAVLASAAPKTQTFPEDCDNVWAAVKRAAAPPHYNFAMLSDQEKKGIVSTGNTLSGKRNLDITLTPDGDSCKVAIGGNFSGLVHDDKGDLFKRIQEQIKPTH